MENFNKQRLFIVIAAGIGVLSTFLPWAKVSLFGISDTASGFSTGGWLSMLLYAGAGILAFLDDKTQGLAKKRMTLMFVLSVLGTLFTLFKIIQISSESMVSASIGVYLAFLAGLALVAIYFFVNSKGEINKTPKKVDFNELKEDLKDLTEKDDKSNQTNETDTSES